MKIKLSPNKILLWLPLLALALAGCREQYKHLSFQPTETPTQTIESIPVAEQTVIPGSTTSADTIGAVPYTYHLLPAGERKAVFDTLLGQDQDVYFIQEPGRETLATFDGQSNTPVRMAQACRIGNDKSSILILLGMSVRSPNEPDIQVYTFEKGRAANVKPYKAGKDSFLEQFQDYQIMNRPKDIHGITGATPIWKPVSKQVRTSYELLLKDKTDVAWIAGIKDTGKIWHRKIVVVDDSEQTTEPQENTAFSTEPPDSTLTVLPAIETAQSEPESFDFMEDDSLLASSENDLLYEHWKTVAAVEISLLACGLLIVAVTQIKRVVYKCSSIIHAG